MKINKILITISISFFIILASFSIWSDTSSINNKLNNIISTENKLEKIIFIKKLVKEIQKERGLSNIYYSNAKYYSELQNQRKILETLINNSLKYSFAKSLKKEIEFVHEKISSKQFTQNQTFDFYSNIISKMLINSEKLFFYTNDAEIKNYLIFYQQLNFIQEYMGQLRGSVGAVFSNQYLSSQNFVSIIKLCNLIENNIQIFNSYNTINKVNIWKNIEEQECVVKTRSITKELINKSFEGNELSTMEWFKLSTCAVDTIDDSTNNYLNNIKVKAKNIKNNLDILFVKHILFWVTVIIITIFLLIVLFKINKKMLVKQKLLENYKKAIDNSTIVSKTDKKGHITYANKAFCDISGYQIDELMGKPHNIVRHPDVDKNIFKDLWDTIKGGDTWTGQVKNLNKNGEAYWVDASISPIYDNDNNLIEYIAIRHDITELFRLNEEIQTTQYELIYRMGESVESRSKESGNHIRRVAKYSKLLAKLYGLEHTLCEDIFIASTMHDMGKIAIPDAILLKPDKLDKDEWDIMKTHAFIGHKILSGSTLPILQMASKIAYEHHERCDGKGYPRGISGQEISIYARIVSIVDVFDALISERVYKKAWEYDKVVKLFQDERGKQFDAKLVDLFLANIDKFMKIKLQYEDK